MTGTIGVLSSKLVKIKRLNTYKENIFFACEITTAQN